MKYSEFKAEVEKLGLHIGECESYVDVVDKHGDTVSCVEKEVTMGIDTEYEDFHNLPPTHLQVGSEAEREGIILVKTAEPNVWMRKHIMVWEMHHGTVPDGYVVSFKDGDKTNCVIDNLFLVSKGALVSVAKRGLRDENPEINYSIHLLTELELAIRRKGWIT